MFFDYFEVHMQKYIQVLLSKTKSRPKIQHIQAVYTLIWPVPSIAVMSDFSAGPCQANLSTSVNATNILATAV